MAPRIDLEIKLRCVGPASGARPGRHPLVKIARWYLVAGHVERLHFLRLYMSGPILVLERALDSQKTAPRDQNGKRPSSARSICIRRSAEKEGIRRNYFRLLFAFTFSRESSLLSKTIWPVSTGGLLALWGICKVDLKTVKEPAGHQADHQGRLFKH